MSRLHPVAFLSRATIWRLLFLILIGLKGSPAFSNNIAFKDLLINKGSSHYEVQTQSNFISGLIADALPAEFLTPDVTTQQLNNDKQSADNFEISSPSTLSSQTNRLPVWQNFWWLIALVLVFSLWGLYLILKLRERKQAQQCRDLSQQIKSCSLALEKSRQDIATLSEIGAEIASTREFDDILNTVYTHLNLLMDANVFYLGMLQPEKQRIQFEIAIERGKRLPTFSFSMDEKSSLAVLCVHSRSPIIINDLELDCPKYLGDLPAEKPKVGEKTESIIYWPLIVADRIIGTLTVQSFDKNAYTLRHFDMLKTIANYTAIALDNAKVYRELRDHKNEAEQATREKSEFLAKMSHELRTPLHGIIGLTELIQQTALDADSTDYANKIDLSAQNLLSVINDILDLSKVEAGAVELEQKSFSLADLLQNIAAVINTLVNDKDLSFEYVVDPQTPAEFISDPVRFYQILLNLCSNAVKFSTQGKIEVRVFPKSITDDICELQIEVVDQGIGMDETTLSKLFQNFSQGSASTNREFGGTGLGLVISKRLANLLGGNVTVTSKLGKGSRFSFSSKLKLNHLGIPHSNDVHNDVHSSNKPTLKTNQQIVLVEDQAENKSTLKRFLKDMKAQLTLIKNINELECLFQAHNVAEVSKRELSSDPENNYSNQNSRPKTQIDHVIINSTYDQNKINDLRITLRKFIPESVNIIICTQNKHHFSQSNDLKLKIMTLQNPVSFSRLYQLLNKVEAPKKKTKTQLLANARLLLVEDNKINQLIAMKILSAAGAQVDIADNGKMAVEMIAKANYQLILMDIQMPQMDGVEATRVIRQTFSMAELPIVAMTANVMNREIDEYLEVGMNDFIGKPYQAENLIQKVKSILAQVKV